MTFYNKIYEHHTKDPYSDYINNKYSELKTDLDLVTRFKSIVKKELKEELVLNSFS